MTVTDRAGHGGGEGLQPILWRDHSDPAWHATLHLEDGTWWAEAVCQVADDTYANGQGPNLEACYADLQESLELYLDDDIPTTHRAWVVFHDAIEAHAELAEAVLQRDLAHRLDALAADTVVRAVQLADSQGVSAPDTAALLGLSRQRIYQIRAAEADVARPRAGVGLRAQLEEVRERLSG